MSSSYLTFRFCIVYLQRDCLWFYICTDIVCSFRMSGFRTIRRGIKQKDKNDLQWEYWRDNRGLKMMKKQKWKPGMSLGDPPSMGMDGGHGHGREWGLQGVGEW